MLRVRVRISSVRRVSSHIFTKNFANIASGKNVLFGRFVSPTIFPLPPRLFRSLSFIFPSHFPVRSFLFFSFLFFSFLFFTDRRCTKTRVLTLFWLWQKPSLPLYLFHVDRRDSGSLPDDKTLPTVTLYLRLDSTELGSFDHRLSGIVRTAAIVVRNLLTFLREFYLFRGKRNLQHSGIVPTRYKLDINR